MAVIVSPRWFDAFARRRGALCVWCRPSLRSPSGAVAVAMFSAPTDAQRLARLTNKATGAQVTVRRKVAPQEGIAVWLAIAPIEKEPADD